MPQTDIDEIMGEIFRLEWSMNREFVNGPGITFDEIPDAKAL